MQYCWIASRQMAKLLSNIHKYYLQRNYNYLTVHKTTTSILLYKICHRSNWTFQFVLPLHSPNFHEAAMTILSQ